MIPGQLYERLQDLYPAEPQHEGPTRALQMMQPGGITAEIMFGPGPQGVRLQSDDGTRLVRIQPGMISVHVLSPYPQWPEFQSSVRRVLQELSAVTAEELDVERIGVRYINKVAALSDSSEISEYFVVRPKDGFGRIWPVDGKYEDAALGEIAERIREACRDS